MNKRAALFCGLRLVLVPLRMDKSTDFTFVGFSSNRIQEDACMVKNGVLWIVSEWTLVVGQSAPTYVNVYWSQSNNLVMCSWATYQRSVHRLAIKLITTDDKISATAMRLFESSDVVLELLVGVLIGILYGSLKKVLSFFFHMHWTNWEYLEN